MPWKFLNSVFQDVWNSEGDAIPRVQGFQNMHLSVRWTHFQTDAMPTHATPLQVMPNVWNFKKSKDWYTCKSTTSGIWIIVAIKKGDISDVVWCANQLQLILSQ
jgi:hypothetical protein